MATPGSRSLDDSREFSELRERIAELEKAARRAIKIMDANINHQWEKIEDARTILREALRP